MKKKKKKTSKYPYNKKLKNVNNQKTICFICQKPISNKYDVVNNKDEKAHFNCVLKNLSKKEKLRKNQSIFYIGGGDFAVVEHYSKSPYDFKILKKIKYENRQKPNNNDFYK